MKSGVAISWVLLLQKLFRVWSNRFILQHFSFKTFINWQNQVVYWFCRGLFVICNHIYFIIGTIQSGNLVQIISLHFSVRCCWRNRLYIAITNVPKNDDMSETNKCSNLCCINYILLKRAISTTCIIWIDWDVALSSIKNQLADSYVLMLSLYFRRNALQLRKVVSISFVFFYVLKGPFLVKCTISDSIFKESCFSFLMSISKINIPKSFP